MGTLRGKNIIITGCNRGIGKAILEKYVEHGCNIYAVVRKITSKFMKDMEELELRGGKRFTLYPAIFPQNKK